MSAMFFAAVALAAVGQVASPSATLPLDSEPGASELSQCTDLQGLQFTFRRYFEALSGPRTETELPALHSLLLPTFRVDVIGRDEAGAPTYYGQDRNEFVRHVSSYRRGRGYYHSPSIPSVRCWGQAASVSASFVSRNDVAGEVIDRGWIDLNMVRKDEAWRIAHATWFSEAPD